MSKSLCACTNKSKGIRCTFSAKPRTLYCGIHAKCANPWTTVQPKPAKIQSVKPEQVKPAKIKPEPINPIIDEEEEGIDLPSRVAYTGGPYPMLKLIDPYYHIYIVKDQKNNYTLKTKQIKKPTKDVLAAHEMIFKDDYAGRFYIIISILFRFILPLLKSKSGKVIYKTLKKLGLTTGVPGALMAEFEDVIGKNLHYFVQHGEQEEDWERRFAEQQAQFEKYEEEIKRVQKLKAGRHSVKPEPINPIIDEEEEGIDLPSRVAYTGGNTNPMLKLIEPYYSIYIVKDQKNNYTLKSVLKNLKNKLTEDVLAAHEMIFKDDYAGYQYIIISILFRFILPLLKSKSGKVIYKTLKKLGLTTGVPGALMAEFEDVIGKNLQEIVNLEEERRFAEQQAQRVQKLKVVRHSDKKDELIYICGNTENCLPVKNSDLLLKFINDKRYASTAFMEIMFKTLQTLYPQACFLHPILIYWENIDNLYLDLTQQNVDKIKETVYAIRLHEGRRNESFVYLEFEKYKQDEIVTCQSGKKKPPLMAIPIELYGHQNMLVIDPTRKEVEHIDPHGSKFMVYGYYKVNSRIEKDIRHLCDSLFPGYTYIDRSDISNFQAKLNSKFENSIHGGTCVVWSLWYAFLRLSNPDESRVSIIKYARSLFEKNDFSDLENFIIKFMKQLTSLITIQEKNENEYIVNGRLIGKKN